MSVLRKTSSLASFRSRPFALFVIAATAYAGLGVRPASSAPSFDTPLPIPPVLSDSPITIHMQQAPVQIFPDQATNMWTFNGTFPGPTIRRPSGAHTEITFVNDLPPGPFAGDPEPAGGMTIHFHGEHAESVDDGQPDSMHPPDPTHPNGIMDPPGCGATLIPIGCSRKYSFALTEGGANPERPAFQWYHDHRMGVTGRDVWMGLAGMMIIDPPPGDSVESTLPTGARDVPIMLADRSFDQNRQLRYPSSNTTGALGDRVLANGVNHAFLQVDDAQYRIRVLNASNVRPYDLALSDGSAFKLIGTESGLLPSAKTITHIRLGPAERAELVLNFAGIPLGQNLILHDRLNFGPEADIMQFRVTNHVTDTSNIPSTLRDLPETVNVTPVVTRTWTLGQSNDPVNPWTINGKVFDPMRVDAQPKLGTSERWVFVNETGDEHFIHIHDVDWRLVFRSGGIPPDTGANVDVDQLKETFRVRAFETIVVQSTFTDHTGVFMFHCHILEHEDHSMMAQFDVLPA